MKKILLVVCLTSLAACETKMPESEILRAEVLAVHDEVMPKMDDLMRYEGAAKRKIRVLDSLSAKDTIRRLEKQQYDSLLTSLKEAEAGMMDWMNHFDGELKSKSEAEKLMYLQAEKIKIEEVRKRTATSLSRAEHLLEKK